MDRKMVFAKRWGNREKSLFNMLKEFQFCRTEKVLEIRMHTIEIQLTLVNYTYNAMIKRLGFIFLCVLSLTKLKNIQNKDNIA